jgi:hypothetical protein
MIRVLVKKVSSNTCSIEIIKQNEKDINFLASNGWRLMSANYPDISKEHKSFYVRGIYAKENNKKSLVDNKTCKEILAALEEYNESYEKKKKPKAEKEYYLMTGESGDIINEIDFDSFDKAVKSIKDRKMDRFESTIFIYKRVAEIVPKTTVEYIVKKL